ncbi:MAG: prepilin-type N-terminal cleavage/methylation domain-containing protein [Fimbriimonas ginsengisoli]|nr:prepilin-type N-terminal cleavage/methylation domain-containing protein [Fimbriimonas ginsengisoli]
MNRSRGFTLLEMSAVVFLIALFASAVLPNLVSDERSRQERAFIVALRRLPAAARMRSITDAVPVRLRTSGTSLTLTEDSTESAQPDPFRTVDAPETVTLAKFLLNDSGVEPADWEVRFYPDGSSDAGSVDLALPGGVEAALNIRSNGLATLDEAVAQSSDETWEAGSYEQR